MFGIASWLSRPTPRRLTERPKNGPLGNYTIAVLASVLALLLRAAVDPVAPTNHFYALSLVAVVFVVVVLRFWTGDCDAGSLSMIGTIYFFIAPRRSLAIEEFGDQLSTALFFVCGVCCAALGRAQLVSRERASQALAECSGTKGGPGNRGAEPETSGGLIATKRGDVACVSTTAHPYVWE